LQLGKEAQSSDLLGYDAVVIATGVNPRPIPLPIKTSRVNVITYAELLKGTAKAGKRVAVIGAGRTRTRERETSPTTRSLISHTTGGIGFDVSEFLTHAPYSESSIDVHEAPLAPKVDQVRLY
jgi:2,4-dienoyl-CoA reductase (NADPH2)